MVRWYSRTADFRCRARYWNKKKRQLTLIILYKKIALVLSEKYSKGEEIDRVTNDYEQEHFKQLETIFKQFISVDVNEMNPNEIISSIKHLFGKE